MVLRQLPEDRASCNQDPKTSSLHGRWAGEWLRSPHESAANQLESSASRLILHVLSVSILVSVFCRLASTVARHSVFKKRTQQ